MSGRSAATGVWREGKLNCMQLDWLLTQPVHLLDFSYEYNQTVRIAGDGATLAQALEAVRLLVCRHEGLRTILDADGSEASIQYVHPPPAKFSEIESMVRFTDADGLDWASESVRRSCFRLTRDWPVRVVISIAGNTVLDIAVICDHSAIDGWGLRILRKDLAHFLAMIKTAPKATSDLPYKLDSATQPLDVTAWESSATGMRHLERSKEFWTRQFETLRGLLEGVTEVSDTALSGNVHFYTLTLTSTDVAVSSEAASRTHQVSRAAVFLAAFGVALCELFQRPAICVLNLVANRISSADLRSVGKMYMKAPVLIRRPDGYNAFTEIALACQRQSLLGQRFAHVDRRAVNHLRDQIVPMASSPAIARATFNFVPFEFGGGSAGTTPDSEDDGIRMEPVRRFAAALMLTVDQDAGRVRMRLTWRNDIMTVEHAKAVLATIAEAIKAAGSQSR